MKGAHNDPVDHARTTQPHAGESFIDTLWLPGLILIGIGTVLIAGTVAATAYGNSSLSLILGLIAGALVTAAHCRSPWNTNGSRGWNSGGWPTIRMARHTCTPDRSRQCSRLPAYA